MTKADLNYHRHLEAITEADVAYVKRKDAQYDASWKRRGGAGAFFTIVRPLDRFENFAAQSGYDVFSLIEREGLDGPDGSAIACVRDARRYLLLLEAEMTERARTAEGYVGTRGVRADVSTVARQDFDTPHSSIYSPPWVVGWTFLNTQSVEAREAWNKVANGVFVLSPRVEPDTYDRLSEDVRRLYLPVYAAEYVGDDGPVEDWREKGVDPASYWLLVSLCPEGERSRWPEYPEEQNLKEYEDLMEARELYAWNPPKFRYVLRRSEWLRNGD